MTPTDLFHVAAQFRVGRLVDFVPVHRNLNLLIQLEDDQGIIYVPMTKNTRTDTDTQKGSAFR